MEQTNFIDVAGLTGQRIADIECVFGKSGEGDSMDTCLTFITLEDIGVINFPANGELRVSTVEPPAMSYPIDEGARAHVIGQAIREISFPGDGQGRPLPGSVAFLELENGYVLHEHRIEPAESGEASIWMYSPEEFPLVIVEEGLNLISYNGSV